MCHSIPLLCCYGSKMKKGDIVQGYVEECDFPNKGRVIVKGEDGKKYLAHTLNNTVVAPPRMLIAFLENNLQFDGTHYSVKIPEALRPYMGGKELITEQ